MELKVCTKMCKECPFSTESLKGYLGGFTVNETLQAISNEILFSCHLHREDSIEENEENVKEGEIPICRGFMLQAKKTGKLFGGTFSKESKGLLKLQKGMIVEKEELDKVLGFNFRTHHKQPNDWEESNKD